MKTFTDRLELIAEESLQSQMPDLRRAAQQKALEAKKKLHESAKSEANAGVHITLEIGDIVHMRHAGLFAELVREFLPVDIRVGVCYPSLVFCVCVPWSDRSGKVEYDFPVWVHEHNKPLKTNYEHLQKLVRESAESDSQLVDLQLMRVFLGKEVPKGFTHEEVDVLYPIVHKLLLWSRENLEQAVKMRLNAHWILVAREMKRSPESTASESFNVVSPHWH